MVWTPLKNISQLGWLFPIYGKIKLMFQTTNQSFMTSWKHISASPIWGCQKKSLRWQDVLPESHPPIQGFAIKHGDNFIQKKCGSDLTEMWRTNHLESIPMCEYAYIPIPLGWAGLKPTSFVDNHLASASRRHSYRPLISYSCCSFPKLPPWHGPALLVLVEIKAYQSSRTNAIYKSYPM